MPMLTVTSSGASDAGNTTGASSTQAWTNPANAASYSGSYASISVPKGAVSTTLRIDFTPTMPLNAFITGIGISTNKYSASGGGSDNFAKIAVNGTTVGTDHASSNWPNPMATYTYGGTGDLWGTTWTPSSINSSTISLFLSVTTALATTYEINAPYLYIYYIMTDAYGTTPATNSLSMMGMGIA